MTVKVDLAEFLSAYIAEADEQLAIATARLLSIDGAARKGDKQPRAVRDLFRAIHTIKGLSSMVGIEPIVTVTHRMETVLREADRAGGSLTTDVADLLLRSVRSIEQCVRAVEQGRSAIEPAPALLVALDAIAPGEAPHVGRGAARLTLDPALDQKLDAFERELLLKAADDGRRALRLDYVPSLARSAEGLNINSVRERVGALAELVRVIPISLPAKAGATGGIAFALLLLSSRSDAELAAAAGVEPSAVTPVVTVEPPAAAVVPAPARLDDDESLSDLGAMTQEPTRRNLLRVDAGRVDEAMDRLGTLLVTRSRLARAIAKLTASGSDTRELANIASENARQLRDLRDSILQVRMVPLTETLDRLPLMLRSLMRSSGRQVRLEIDAHGAELDKAVAERIFPAIVHLVRNAVDHGIEPPEARRQLGKAVEGTIGIRCSARSGTRLDLTIQDDGRGVDAAAVAARLGVREPESDSALLELLCQPGFSTRDEATTTSGRGLGMDIVKKIVVEQLGGELTMHAERGVGTQFTLRIPLTVAIVDAFIVDCAGQRFAVPVSTVEEIVEIDPAAVVAPPRSVSDDVSFRSVAPIAMVERRGETLPLFALAALLDLRAGPVIERRALIVRKSGEPIGFLLDGVSTQQEAVIRPLVDPLVRVPGISASTDLGDGRPTLVLDLVALTDPRRRWPRALPPAPPALPGREVGAGVGAGNGALPQEHA